MRSDLTRAHGPSAFLPPVLSLRAPRGRSNGKGTFDSSRLEGVFNLENDEHDLREIGH